MSFIGGPFDGDGILELKAPEGLEIKSIDVIGHPEGTYRIGPEGRFIWHFHQN